MSEYSDKYKEKNEIIWALWPVCLAVLCFVVCGSTVVSAELRLRMVRYGCSGVRKTQVRYKSEGVSDTARRRRGWLDR